MISNICAQFKRVRAYFILVFVLLLFASLGECRNLVIWEEGVLTHQDLEGFLWGEDAQICTKGNELSVSREVSERLFLTEFVYQKMIKSSKNEMLTLSPIVQNQFNKFLIWRWVEDECNGNLNIEEEELRKEYQESMNNFKQEQSYSFRRLFFPFFQELEKEKAIELAANSLNYLNEGKSFEDVVMAFNLDKKYLDVLGPFLLGKVNPEIENTLLKLQPGETSKVIAREYGFQIVELVEMKKEFYIPFLEAREILIQNKKMDCIREELEKELFQNKKLETTSYFDPTLKVYFSKYLQRDLTASEVDFLKERILKESLSKNLDKTEESIFVKGWLEKRYFADEFFRKEFENNFEKEVQGDGFKTFYDNNSSLFKESDKFKAAYIEVSVNEVSTHPAKVFLSRKAATTKINELMGKWKEGIWLPQESEEVKKREIKFFQMENLMTIPQAGRQVSESIKNLETGEFGSPVFSEAKNTYIASKLLEKKLGKKKPFNPEDENFVRTFKSRKLRNFKKDFIQKATSEGKPEYLIQ